ncbi:hypothetical protein IWW36_000603 [Coemansia brasiliensis]|uniref:AAA+ ATPase domain-containing protein n=1 Tax=Coemansia brasiliensis TaxID=2650707 RepID=A0A9W8M2R9_9FUNG|nr:hypothetical protein IWW36_000603 [Coemansia brasiliensis]
MHDTVPDLEYIEIACIGGEISSIASGVLQSQTQGISRIYSTTRWQTIIKRQILGATVSIEHSFTALIGSRDIEFKVSAISPDHTAAPVVAGYESIVSNLTRQINFSNHHFYHHLGIQPQRIVYVCGVPGVGKSTVIKSALKRVPFPVVYGSLQNIVLDASGTELADEFVAMSLEDLVDRAKAAAPSVLVLYDVDVLADAEQTEGIAARHFIQFIDSIPRNVMLILESGVADAMLPVSIKRSRALEHRLEIPVPRLGQRREILYALQKAAGEQLSAELLGKVANATAGYVARDIAALFRQAILKRLRQKQTEALEVKLQQLAIAEVPDDCLKWQHFADSLHIVRPSQQLCFESSRPARRWADIGGYGDIKQKLQQFMRLATSETALQLGITPPSGILLYGPSGCGKTVLAQAMIGESHCNVINIRGSELFSKYLGETEARLRQLFEAARAAAPCVVFMDEIDSIAAKREWSSVESGGPALRVLSTLLNEMDGVHATRGVVVVSCTNQIERVDDAIIRPGRFDELVEIPMPTADDRRGILQTLAQKSSFASDVGIDQLSQMTDGFSGAALEQLVRDAGLAAMRSDRTAQKIAMADFSNVLQKTDKQTQL